MLQSDNNHTANVEYLPLDYNSKIINKVTDYIIKNISKSEMDTNIISHEVGVSRTQLWRIFKKSVGKTLGDYVHEIKMKKASEMIKSGKYRISEIAYELGYSDPKYFTKCFTKEFGVPPTSFLESSSTHKNNS